MIDQINELPEDGLKSSPKTSRFTENKWISRKNQNKLYFLHPIDTVPKHYGLPHTLRIVFPNVHIYILNFNFCLADS